LGKAFDNDIPEIATLELILDGKDETLTIRIIGELVATTCPALRDVVTDSISRQPKKIILDMSQVPFIDTSGLGVLVGLRATLKSQKIAFEVANPSDRVINVFRLTRLDSVFGIGQDN